MTDITRRKFFGFLGGAAVAPLAVMEAAKANIVGCAEFGWTWFFDKSKNIDLSEIISTTLRENAQKIAESVGEGNSLLIKLKDSENDFVQVNFITEQEQNRRIIERTNKRLNERKAKRYGIKEENVAISAWKEPEPTQFEWIAPYQEINTFSRLYNAVAAPLPKYLKG